MRMRKSAFVLTIALVQIGCSSVTPQKRGIDRSVDLNPSYLETEDGRVVSVQETGDINASVDQQVDGLRRTKRLKPLELTRRSSADTEPLGDELATTDQIKVSSEQLPLKDFIHYVYGELLGLDYIVDPTASNDATPMTMNIQRAFSSRDLFDLTNSLLESKQYTVSRKDKIYYITSNQAQISGNMLIGVGSTPDSVPDTNLDVMQIVSMKYGFKSKLSVVLQQIASVTVLPDAQQGVIFIRGKADEVRKALEFVVVIDQPSPLAKNIAAIDLVYSTPGDFVGQLSTVLSNEGIDVATGSSADSSVILTSIPASSQILVFARNDIFLERVLYWAEQLDVAPRSNEKKYFVFQPDYARAVDLGESLAPLLGGFNETEQQAAAGAPSTSRQQNTTANEARSGGAQSVESEALTMVVDERTNSLVFYTSGQTYSNLLPLVRRLDVQPKQVLLEIVIAEVTLNDSFEKGVEFNIRDGAWGAGTVGALGLSSIGGFTYQFVGANSQLQAKLFQDASLINLLSRPSILVRDGTSATIDVGTDLPIVGQTTEDPINGERQTTQIEYRRTGIQLGVTPTVNSKGVVTMQITQSISNEVESGTSTLGTPSIFTRDVSTEVVAESGQTIILGGLISENSNQGETKVPFFGDIPVLGQLFRSDNQSSAKTELVMLVTPRIIENRSQWDTITRDFKNQLENLKF